MQCFELGEKLRRGILAVYPYVFLGHPGATRSSEELQQHLQEGHGLDEPVACTTCHTFRWDGWSRLPAPGDTPSMVLSLGNELRDWIRAELIEIDKGQPLLLTHAQLTKDLTLERANMEDDCALLLIRNGGQVSTRNRHARVAIDAGDQIVVLRPCGLVRVVRTGALEGARAEFILGWDGRWMHALHETVRPSRRMVVAAAQEARTGAPVRRLIEHAPSAAKVTLTVNEVSALGLPQNAHHVRAAGARDAEIRLTPTT